MIGRWMRGAAVACVLAVAGQAYAGCLDDRLAGVNLAGAEFNSKVLPGVMYKNYVYPTAEDIAYFASKGATALRLPFRWERAQRTLMGELDAPEIAAISKVVATASSLGLCVILDAHNYATYHGRPIGSVEVPNDAFIDLWERMGQQFPNADQVAFGLMNEPKNLLISQWAQLAGETVHALREAGVQNMLLVSGGRWSGVHEWHKFFSGTSNELAFAGLRDPLDRMALEVHQYADRYYSGTGLECHPPAHFDTMFERITAWAKANGQTLFMGEFGTPGSPECLETLDHMLTLTVDTSVWAGWTYWAAGRWWGDYPLSIHPKAGVDAPQMSVVEKHLLFPVAPEPVQPAPAPEPVVDPEPVVAETEPVVQPEPTPEPVVAEPDGPVKPVKSKDGASQKGAKGPRK